MYYTIIYRHRFIIIFFFNKTFNFFRYISTNLFVLQMYYYSKARLKLK